MLSLLSINYVSCIYSKILITQQTGHCDLGQFYYLSRPRWKAGMVVTSVPISEKLFYRHSIQRLLNKSNGYDEVAC